MNQSLDSVENKTKNKISLPTIKDYVKATIGNVPGLIKIDVINLWDNRYRVNVWAEVEANKRERGKGFYEVPEDIFKEKRIVHSFFIVWSVDGPLYSNPKLKEI